MNLFCAWVDVSGLASDLEIDERDRMIDAKKACHPVAVETLAWAILDDALAAISTILRVNGRVAAAKDFEGFSQDVREYSG